MGEKIAKDMAHGLPPPQAPLKRSNLNISNI
jgi:hypothetical protein